MQDQLSQLYTSAVDFISKSAEVVQNVYKQMAEKGQVSEEFLQEAEERKAELEAQVGKILERVAENLHIATTTQIHALQQRVETLEAEVKALKQTPQNK